MTVPVDGYPEPTQSSNQEIPDAFEAERYRLEHLDQAETNAVLVGMFSAQLDKWRSKVREDNNPLVLTFTYKHRDGMRDDCNDIVLIGGLYIPSAELQDHIRELMDGYSLAYHSRLMEEFEFEVFSNTGMFLDGFDTHRTKLELSGDIPIVRDYGFMGYDVQQVKQQIEADYGVSFNRHKV